MARIQRALISVFDKTGLIPFAQTLVAAKVELLSTGGTARVLRDAGLPLVELSDYTGFPEMLDGRVKTLHPKVHGGLLFLRGNPKHEAAVKQHGIGPIDLVVVNLYPFEQTVAKPNVPLAEAIENIDIGGPSLLRSAAKNHQYVTVVMDPADYGEVAAQIKAKGNTTPAFRRKLAARVFARTSAYDAAIATHLIKVFGAAAPALAGPVQSSLPLELAGAEAIAEIFSEVIVAPEFHAEALELLRQKKNVRLLKLLNHPLTSSPWDIRSVGADSFLMQERDLKAETAADLKVVTK